MTADSEATKRHRVILDKAISALTADIVELMSEHLSTEELDKAVEKRVRFHMARLSVNLLYAHRY